MEAKTPAPKKERGEKEKNGVECRLFIGTLPQFITGFQRLVVWWNGYALVPFGNEGAAFLEFTMI